MNTGLTRNAPLSMLEPSTTYYWQVKALNGDGETLANAGNWWSFTTNVCYQLRVFALPAGSVSVDLGPNCAGSRYSAGSVVHLTAIPNPGDIFVRWTGDASGIINPLTVTMTRNKTINAIFETHDSLKALKSTHELNKIDRGRQQWRPLV